MSIERSGALAVITPPQVDIRILSAGDDEISIVRVAASKRASFVSGKSSPEPEKEPERGPENGSKWVMQTIQVTNQGGHGDVPRVDVKSLSA